MAAEPVENGTTTTTTESDTVPSSTVKMESDAPEQAATETASAAAKTTAADKKKWPGWPGQTVYRLIVPVQKVGSIIGKKGEIIKKLTEETKARVRVLEAIQGTTDRIVLVTGQEEPDAPIAPAMNAVLRIFKRVTGLNETEGEGVGSSAAAAAPCTIRLLVPASQAINLIGKQGSNIKSIQDSSEAAVRVLAGDELPFYAAPNEERVIDIQGETLKVYRALEAVISHLRKFLVDQSILASFEKIPTSYQVPTPASQEHAIESAPWADKTAPWAEKTHSFQTAPKPGINSDYIASLKRDPMFLDPRDSHHESQVQHSGLSLYGQDPALTGGLRGSTLSRAGAGPIVTQMTQTMQIPLSYAEDIIGIHGGNIGFIRRASGAILTVQESRDGPEEIMVEIKGTSKQVQTAQQLIHESINSGHNAHKEPVASSYGKLDSAFRPSYSQSGNPPYSSSSLPPPQSYGGYGSSGLGGGYSGFRL